MAPRAVARCQNSPPKKAGASCAIAAKDNRPDRGQLGLAQRAIVEIGHRHDREDRKAPRRSAGSGRNPAARCRISRRRCNTSGMMMSFETMTESATHSTITIAVAADRPPTKTATLSSGASPSTGSASTYMSGIDRAERKGDQSRKRDRNHEQVDRHQVKRKQPARAADFRRRRILDHADMELARQQHDRAERQQRHGQEIADRRHVFDARARLPAFSSRARSIRAARTSRR